MARDRTEDEILDQLVYAVASVARHYGPGLNPAGLAHMRGMLAGKRWWCDSTWRVDIQEPGYWGDEPQPGFNADEPNPDFCPSVIPDGYLDLDFATVAKESRTGEYAD